MRTPPWVLAQVLGQMLGKQNVTAIAAIHHPLRDVDPGAGNIRLLVQVTDFIDGAAVNAHPYPQFGMGFEFPANLDRAEDRRFRAGTENKRAAITSGQAEQFAFRFSEAELLRAAHDLFQCLKKLALLRDEHFRVTDDVDEQDMPDLKFHVGGRLGRHEFLLSQNSRFNESIPVRDIAYATATL